MGRSERGDEGGDLGDPANVFVFDPALQWRFSLGVAGEKSTMVFFEVGVAMPTRGEHEVDESRGQRSISYRPA